MSQHALVIRFKYRTDDMEPLYELEDQIGEALDEAGVGEYDGSEMAIDGKQGEMTMTGPDAHALWETVQPVLEGARFMRGAEAELRFGTDEDADTEIMTVGS